MSDMSLTPEQIREGREKMHLTQQQLADEVGVSRRTVTSWERGESAPQNRAAAVAEVLGLHSPLKPLPEFGHDAILRRLGTLAKQRREELGLSRPSFAREIGIGSDSTIRDFEFGRRLPWATNRPKIERGLGWRLGAISDTLLYLDRKAASIRMEELDAEDSLFIAKESGQLSLALIPDEELLAEVARRMRADRRVQAPLVDGQGLYGLAASTNSEHLEDEDGEPV